MKTFYNGKGGVIGWCRVRANASCLSFWLRFPKHSSLWLGMNLQTGGTNRKELRERCSKQYVNVDEYIHLPIYCSNMLSSASLFASFNITHSTKRKKTFLYLSFLDLNPIWKDCKSVISASFLRIVSVSSVYMLLASSFDSYLRLEQSF